MKNKQFKITKPNTLMDRVLVLIGNLFFVLCLMSASALIIFSSVTIECEVIGSSMQPTYNDDIKNGHDVVFVNQYNHDYDYGDIVVIDVGEDDPIIKRVIGLPGDIIDIVYSEDYGYKLQLNGILIEEDYLKIDWKLDREFRDGMATTYGRFNIELREKFPELFESGKLVVPEGEIFALGDNRHDSKDSTYYGTFDSKSILGIVELERKYDENKFAFYWNYVTLGKFFDTIINCF